MFPEELEAIGEAAWAAPDRIGIRFVASSKGPGALSAQAWFEKLVAQGEMPDSSSTLRLVPSIARVKAVRLAQTSSAGARLRSEEQAPLLTALP
jgi:hypothetical protein